MDSSLLDLIQVGCAEIAELIRVGDSRKMAEILDETNESGDAVKMLDDLSNQILIEKLKTHPDVRLIASEENDEMIETGSPAGEYLVAIDPLDGSSNIAVNVTVGTIFSVFQLNDEGRVETGRQLLMSGYCLYGGSTQMVVALVGVRGLSFYQLVGTGGQWKLLQDDLLMKTGGKIYAVNHSNQYKWVDPRIQQAVDHFISQGYTQRWVASLVADAHRTILKGGFFAYPADQKNQQGKIRLIYEAYPFALIFESAGGIGVTGSGAILDLPFPHENIHQRTPIILTEATDPFFTC